MPVAEKIIVTLIVVLDVAGIWIRIFLYRRFSI